MKGRSIMDMISQGVSAAKSEVDLHMGTEIEKKVKKATSNENWGASGSEKDELARLTFRFGPYNEIMPLIWKRLGVLDSDWLKNHHVLHFDVLKCFCETGHNWRIVFKTLTLLQYLITNGSEKVVDESRDRIFQIKSLIDFRHIDNDGRDRGSGIRELSKAITILLNNSNKLKDAREKSRKNRSKFSAIGNTGFGSDRYHTRASPRYAGGASPHSDFSYGNERYDDSSSHGTPERTTRRQRRHKKEKTKRTPSPSPSRSSSEESESSTERRNRERKETRKRAKAARAAKKGSRAKRRSRSKNNSNVPKLTGPGEDIKVVMTQPDDGFGNFASSIPNPVSAPQNDFSGGDLLFDSAPRAETAPVNDKWEADFGGFVSETKQQGSFDACGDSQADLALNMSPDPTDFANPGPSGDFLTSFDTQINISKPPTANGVKQVEPDTFGDFQSEPVQEEPERAQELWGGLVNLGDITANQNKVVPKKKVSPILGRPTMNQMGGVMGNMGGDFQPPSFAQPQQQMRQQPQYGYPQQGYPQQQYGYPPQQQQGNMGMYGNMGMNHFGSNVRPQQPNRYGV